MGAIIFSENETPNFYTTLSDAATDQYPRAYVYNYDKTLKETVNLTHNGNGMYIGTAASAYTHNTYSVVYKIFSDAGRTTLNTNYWVVEDILTVAYQPTWGNSGGGSGGNIVFDMKRLAEAVWDHPFPKKIMEILEVIKEGLGKVKDIVSRVTDIRVIQAIKDIKFPKFPPFPKFPKIPPYPKFPEIPEPANLEPIEDTQAEILKQLKKLEEAVSEVDYGNTLSQLVEVLENKVKNEHSEKLEEIKRLIK